MELIVKLLFLSLQVLELLKFNFILPFQVADAALDFLGSCETFF